MRRCAGMLAFVTATTLWSAPCPAQGIPPRWELRLAGQWIGFSGGLETPVGTSDQATFSPEDRFGLEISGARQFGRWEAELDVAASWGNVTGEAGQLRITDPNLSANLTQLSATMGYRVLQFARGDIVLAAGPTLGLWSLGGFESDNATTWGGQVRLSLHVPLGRVALTNSVGYELSGSPFPLPSDVPDARLTSLSCLTVGIGLGLGL